MFDYKNEEINAFRDRLAEIRSHMWNLSTRQIISLTKDTEGNYRTAKMDNKLSYMTVAGMYEDIDPEKYYYYVTLLARGQSPFHPCKGRAGQRFREETGRTLPQYK